MLEPHAVSIDGREIQRASDVASEMHEHKGSD